MKRWPEGGCAEIRHDGGTQIVVLADCTFARGEADLVCSYFARQINANG